MQCPQAGTGAAAALLSRLITRATTTRHLHQLHARIITTTFPIPTASYLLSRLTIASTSISLPYAAALLLHTPYPTLPAFNAVIRAHPRPLPIYSQLLSSAPRPDHLTFPFLLKHCSLIHNSLTGRSLHSHVLALGFHADHFIQNSIIYLYSTSGMLDCAVKVFDKMPVRDVVSWNTLLIGYLRCGEFDAAMELFRGMVKRNVRSWNSVISGFVRGGRTREALVLFHEMLLLSDDKPDKMTVASVVSACAAMGALDQGRWVHGYLKRQRLEFDVVIGTALVDMYGKCGCVERAREVFEEMKEKDVLAWTAMISVLASQGFGEEAFGLLEEMGKHGMKPNSITFGALLSACVHSGLVEKGRWCFDVMKRVYSIKPQQQHYACMVDLLGRAGLFEEAEMCIASMPMEPDVFVWGALLGACRMHGNVKLGEKVASYLIGMDPENHAFYIILSDLYAKANMFEDVKRVRSLMREQGIEKKAPGCSMIEVHGNVHEFSVKGTPKDLMNEIEGIIKFMSDELKHVGHSSDEIV